VRVEIYDNEAVREQAGEDAVKKEQFYRLPDKSDKGLLSLDKLTEELEALRKAQPPLKRIDLDLGRKGSPSRLTDRVEKLREWAREHDLAVFPPR
jgi:hypothetical protein